MAEVTLGRGFSFPRTAVIEWAVPRSELLIMATLMLVALVMRLWNLGDMALHHDESLHAQYSWYLYNGDGYQHNPLMHGPFLFHSGAAVFFLFGDTDMTARLLPAIFGTVLVGMPYLLRKQIGMPAVIIAAVLLMFSPTLLYYSRFIRNEAYMMVWTLGMVICVWRYLDDQRERWLYAFAALLALSFATKEVTFITVAIMLMFVDLMLAVELGKRRAREVVSDTRVALRTAALAPFAWLVAAGWPLTGQRWHFARDRLPAIGDVLVVLGTLSLPQFAAGIQVLAGDKGYDVPEEDFLRVSTVATLLILSAYAGLLWRPRVWLIAAACFFVPYILLYTTFFTNIDGFFSGIWGSLDYWLDQHHVKRGNQPQYYYALMTPLYEFLPLLIGAAGAAWMLLRGDSLRRWLVFWTVAIFAGLSIAGEKMPWLEAHIALPLALMAAVALARALDVLELRGGRCLTAAIGALVTAGAVLLMVDGDGAEEYAGYALAAALAGWLLISLMMPSFALRRPVGSGHTPAERQDDPARRGRDVPLTDQQDATKARTSSLVAALTSTELQITLTTLALGAVVIAILSLTGKVDQWFAVWVLALIPVVLVGYVMAGIAAGNKVFGRALLTVGVAALFTLTVRAAVTVSYVNNDTPVELMVYTQTSPDIPELRDRIDALAERSGLGDNLPIVVDNADSFAWPWAWYLRDYNSVSFANIDENYEPPAGAVLLINRTNAPRIDASQYAQAPYKHRWWFDETYRDLNFREAADELIDSSSRAALVDFFFHRRDPLTKTGSIDGVAFFPNDLSAFDYEPGPEVQPATPTVMADGRIVIGNAAGQPGTAVRGELWQPADLFVDGEGNLWVADARNNRIQKFDAQGNFLASFGRAGQQPGAFNEPWGVAVDAQGFIYVADTWNHRIQKFAPDFTLMASWGVPGTDVSDPTNLFGPRDIAVAEDGTLWVMDTGNQRMLHFTPDLQPILIGSENAVAVSGFSEPTSVTISPDGGLLVASAWTGDIRRIDASGEETGTIDVGWTSQLVLDKPYITVLTSGRILASLPETGELVLFEADGTKVGAWQPLAQSKPVGVVAMPDGGFAFSDVGRNEIQVVPGSLIAQLFE